MWQSSLCRDLFLDLPVGNTRGGVVVSYALKILSPVAPTKHCSRQKSETWSENVSSHQTSMWQSSLYKNPFMALQVGNARGDLLVAYAIKISHQFQHKDIVVG
jgi:hypothetical protein